MHNQNYIIKMLTIANLLQTFSPPAVRDAGFFKTQKNTTPLLFPPKMFCHLAHYFCVLHSSWRIFPETGIQTLAYEGL